MFDESLDKKEIILGTALWGWGVTRIEAFHLIERYLESGGMVIDTATNYPINRCKEDFGLAIKWLKEWMDLYPNEKFSLIVKIGSKNNMGGPEFDLNPNSIFETTKLLRDTFGDFLSCISVHWDNRGSESQDQLSISQTVEAMGKIRESGLNIGLSGIKDPEQYYCANPALSSEWIIQVKENFLTNQARLNYEKFFPKAKYFAYGINMGGLKLENNNSASSINLRGIKVEESFVNRIRVLLESNHGVEPRPISLNQLSLAFAYFNDSLSGVIIGPRNTQQFDETLYFWKDLENSKNREGWFELFKTVMEEA